MRKVITFILCLDSSFVISGSTADSKKIRVVVSCILHKNPFLTRELRACARASYRYDVGNGIRSLARSLDWSIPVNFFSILGF